MRAKNAAYDIVCMVCAFDNMKFRVIVNLKTLYEVVTGNVECRKLKESKYTKVSPFIGLQYNK